MTDRAAAPPHRRARARRGEGERLRDEIVDAAERLLVETGDADRVSIRAVADAVGVTPPSIYLHFTDKAEMLLNVCGRHFAEFDTILAEAAAAASGPLDALRRKSRAYVRFGVDNPEHYRILFMVRNPARRLDDDRPAAQAFTHLVEDVSRCLEAGVFAPANPMLVATGLWAAFHGLTSLLISSPGFPWPDFDVIVDHIVDVHLRGLARR
ncbi:MAG: TetR/AcrR family transcriptional regulator [Acidimicrobiales bacterium]